MTNLLLFAEDICTDNGLITIIRFIKYGVIPTIEIIIPIAIIVLGILDLAKAAVASKEDEIKAARKMFFKRLIYAVAIFFVSLIVTVAVSLVSKSGDDSIQADNFVNCWKQA